MKRLMSLLVIVSVVLLTTGIVQAADFDDVTGDGLWSTAANWDSGSVPGSTTDVRIGNGASEWKTCTITNFVATASRVRIGEDAGGTLNIMDGGTLTTGSDDVRVGYDKAAGILNLVSGEMTVGKDLEIGQDNVGTFNMTTGTVTITDDLEIGKSYTGIMTMNGGTVVLDNTFEGDSVIRVYASGSLNIHGGTVSAPNLAMSGSAVIDLWQDGELFIEDISTNELAAFIADGQMLGNRLTNNVNIVWGIVDPGTTNAITNATITAIDSIPNLAGLSTNEAAEVLAVFGYVIGTTTEGTAPGGITGLVAAQVPAAGTAPIAPGSSIDLVIQEGGEVPNVIGEDYNVATNIIVQSQYIVGVETETYVFEATPGLVTAQSPTGGVEAAVGTAVDISFNERMAVQSTIVATSSGDWMTPSIWDLLVAPWKSTQNYEIKIPGGLALTLSDFAAMRRLHIGHDGVGIAQLDIDGGTFVGLNDYVAVGWNAEALLNVNAGGTLECRKALRIGWNGSSATINIDGGTVTVANDWMSLGRSDQTNSATGSPYESEINIKNGGSLLIHHFRAADELLSYDFGVINIAEGTFATIGSDTNAIVDALASGLIVIAEGYVSSQALIDGNYTLTSRLPTYEGWASSLGIGGENEDEDEDLRDNLYEYALNGDPKDPLNMGFEPVFVDENGVFTYTHLSRADDSNLVYTVQTKKDLVNGDWADTESTISGTDSTGGDYNVVTNIISTVDDQSFIRLKVTNP